ncbi:hypothetical protein LSAT2_016247 [Lamellibrachia satsuma]|nr:hypothetical protein LSAT2_016247 [Lamellibrachia satsuma]
MNSLPVVCYSVHLPPKDNGFLSSGHTTTKNHLIDWEGATVVDRESHSRRRQGVTQKEKTGSHTVGEDRESHRRRRQGVTQKRYERQTEAAINRDDGWELRTSAHLR